MKNILVINDFSPEAGHALAYGTMMATVFGTKLYVWNIEYNRITKAVKELVCVSSKSTNAAINFTINNSASHTTDKANYVSTTTLSDLDTDNLSVHEVVVKYEVQLIIKGVNSIFSPLDQFAAKALATSYCPLLLVPQHASLKPLKRMVYMADLRYCRIPVFNYLKEVAKNFNSGSAIAQTSASGLPDVEENYGKSLYEAFVKANSSSNTSIDYTFNHIKERNTKKAADVLVHMMHTDFIAMAYRKFHFTSLTSQDNHLPGVHHIPVPVMLFPS